MDIFNELVRARVERPDKPSCDRNHQGPAERWSSLASSTNCERTSNSQASVKRLSVNITVAFICFIIFLVASQVHSLKNRYGTITVISAKPCQNALGQFGTCMFMWDCIKSEGVHLGTCSDRFLFGSCCYHSSPLSLALANDGTNQRLNSSGLPTNQNASFVTLINDDSQQQQQQQHSTTTAATIASPLIGNSALSFKPDRVFLSSHSSSSSGPSDYVTTTSSSASANSSNSDHIVNLNYDPPSSNATRDQQSSNKIYAPSLASNDWTSSAEATGESSHTVTTLATTTTTSTTTTTTTTTTTPMPISHQQLSGQPHWHQVHLNYTTTRSPIMQSLPSSSGTGGYLRPSPTHSDANQVMAYQLISRPAGQLLQAPTTLHPSSLPTVSPPLETGNQTPRPASSWLSRPSLLANAIFHSFKPYLNPNRQRPTYRPYIGGGFRPQNHPQRPLLAQQQQHRPLLFLPTTIASINQQQTQTSSPDSTNSMQLNDGKISMAGSGSSSGGNQQEHSDHHIVNPITMTDRRRPIDQNNQHQNNLISSMQTGDSMSQTATMNGTSIISDQQKEHDIAHYEMLNGSHEAADNGNSSIKISPIGNNTSPSLSSDNADYMQGGSHANTTSVNYANMATNWPTSSSTSTTPTSATTLLPQSGFLYDFNGTHHGGYGTDHHHHLPAVNESVASPSYPLISSGYLVTPPVSDGGSIDEIHGLMDGNHQYEPPNKPLAPPPLPPPPQEQQQNSLSQMANGSLLNELNGYHSNGAQNGNSFVTSNKNSSHANSGAVQPSETIMIGNIDEPPPRPVTSESVPDSSASTVSSSLQSVGSAPQPPDISQGCTTTAASVPTRPPHQSHQHHHHHHQVAPSLVGSSGGANKEATCGVTALYPQTKVVGGKNAAFGAWPWQVSVRKVSFFGFSSTHRCGGAVISSEWIATAGHCVEDLALQSIRIRVGEYDFSTMAEPYPHIERGARKKVVHPKYNFYTYENDLALVQLDQPLQFSPHVAPICLPPDNIDLVGRNATVTGWGRLNEGGTLPTILQEVIVPIVSNDKCRDMFLRAGRPEYIPDIFLCAGYEEGGRDSCQGDSGGPLQVRGDDGRWVLAGIISWGIGCAEPLLVGVCSAIQRFKPWIQSTISATS